ncbi:MAG: N-acetylneuraminate synthase family protein [Candidatus Neomarinimicrobiota bacterium]
MLINNIETDEKVFIIAEIGNNHEGDFNLAKEMILLAAEAGADAVKFQTFKTECYINVRDEKRFQMLKSFELNNNQFEKLKNYASEKHIGFISTPFDINSAKFLDQIVDAIKISSSDNNFFPLLKTVFSSDKPVIISTGLSNLNEIEDTLNYILSICENINFKNKLALLHCVTSYPVEYQYANLKAIKTLRDNFDVTIGYSDHTLGINAAIASVGIGARIIEKHFTKNKNYSDFRDHKISADPDEFFKMVRSIREVELMLGNGEKVIQEPEKKIKSFVRRSIVASHNIKKGTILSLRDINWVRPGGGISSKNTEDVIGKILNEDLVEGQKIQYHHLH